MNDELRHANNYKYIKREWKNGKWQYTYEDSKGNSPKKSLVSRPKKILSNKVAKIYRRPTPQQKLDPPRPKNILSDKVADVFKRESVSERLDVAVAKKNSKTAMQRTPNKSVKNDEPKKLHTSEIRERPDKWLDSTTTITISGGGKTSTHTVYNKGKITLATEAAKKKIAEGKDWLDNKLKDALGYDEKERYEQKLKENKGLNEARDSIKKERERMESFNVTGVKSAAEAERRLDHLRESLDIVDSRLRNNEYETKKAKKEYAKTAVGIVDLGSDWLRKKLGLK